MDKIDLLYDHYKDTYSLSKQAQMQRNKLFVWLCALEALSFLSLIKPDELMDNLTSSINSHFNVELAMGNAVLQTLLWILTAYVTVRYCQEVLYIERQYGYIDHLEKEISKESHSGLFEREGTWYNKDYPMVLNFIDLFYKMFCPILFAAINISRIYMEWSRPNRAEGTIGKGTINLSLLCDTFIFGAIMIVTWFYFFEIHSKITEWVKQHIPFVDKIAIALRKVLKEV